MWPWWRSAGPGVVGALSRILGGGLPGEMPLILNFLEVVFPAKCEWRGAGPQGAWSPFSQWRSRSFLGASCCCVQPRARERERERERGQDEERKATGEEWGRKARWKDWVRIRTDEEAHQKTSSYFPVPENKP